MNIGLCLLTKNEITGCKNDVPLLPLESFSTVFAIDANSTDGTCEYLESQLIKVVQQRFPTYNGAYWSAFLECECDALIFFHPKGSIDPHAISQLIQLLKEGNEFIVASRNMKGAINEEDIHLLKPRKWFVQLLGFLTRLRWKNEGRPINDILHGMRGLSREAFNKMKITKTGITADLEMVVASYKYQIKRVEFPVTEKKRLAGKSHFKAWPTGKSLLKYFFKEALNYR
jgi:hypothetical protein